MNEHKDKFVTKTNDDMRPELLRTSEAYNQ
jgi:hypothetical protein